MASSGVRPKPSSAARVHEREGGPHEDRQVVARDVTGEADPVAEAKPVGLGVDVVGSEAGRPRDEERHRAVGRGWAPRQRVEHHREVLPG